MSEVCRQHFNIVNIKISDYTWGKKFLLKLVNFMTLAGLGCCLFYCGGSVVVDLLFNVLPIVCGSSVYFFGLLCITSCPFEYCNHQE